MKLYRSNEYQNETNPIYNIPVEITNVEDLRIAVAYDHVAADYRHHHRGINNYLSSDCLMMDVDNAPAKGAPDDIPPEDWKDIDDIRADLPGVELYVVTSRNHMKEKDGRPARPKYHIYFPIPTTTSAIAYGNMKKALQQYHPYFDANAKDAARFFYGNRDAQVWYYPGNRTIADYILDRKLSEPDKSTEKPALTPRASTPTRTAGSTVATVDNGLYDLMEVVAAIDPARLDYEEWVKVGMAMHRYPETFTVDDWDAWSQTDPRYKPRDCYKRWNGFSDSRVGVGAQFLIDTAKAHGWTPPARKPRLREVPPPPEPPAYMTRPTEPSPVVLREPDPIPDVAQNGEIHGVSSVKEKKFTIPSAGTYITAGTYDDDIRYFREYADRKTGFQQLDQYLTLYPGLVALGGASSLGKTTFAINLVDRLLARGETVLYFSLEQLPIELTTKSIARIVKETNPRTIITNIDIKNGASTPDVMNARREYAKLAKNLYIIPGDFRMTAQDITNTVETFRKEHNGVKPIVVVDYLQLIAPPYGFRGGIREITDENIKTLKDMQKRNGLFVIMISSFNRSTNMEPLSYESFKETGAIEYTNDYVWGLQLSVLDADNTDFYSATGPRQGRRETSIEERRAMINAAQQQTPKQVEFISLKNRNGRQFFKAYFDYYPANDLFVETGVQHHPVTTDDCIRI